MAKKQLFSAEQVSTMTKMREEGLTFAAIAKKFGVVPSTVYSYVSKSTKVDNSATVSNTSTINSLQKSYTSALQTSAPAVLPTKKSLSSKVKSFFTSLIGR